MFYLLNGITMLLKKNIILIINLSPMMFLRKKKIVHVFWNRQKKPLTKVFKNTKIWIEYSLSLQSSPENGMVNNEREIQ